MRLFKCQACSNPIYFENTACVRCNHQVAYLPQSATMSALEPIGSSSTSKPIGSSSTSKPTGSSSTSEHTGLGKVTALADPDHPWKPCANAGLDACNWLLPAASTDTFCAACRHNRTVPHLPSPGNMDAWRRMELAKHRLIYSLMRLGLPLPNRDDDPAGGLVFDFLEDPASPHAPKVLTGHDEGVVTLALKEADDAERERRRTEMHEPYRTLLGHFRHEVGHFYWNILVRDQDRLTECREVFGNDEEDYAEALQRHYDEGAPPDWQDHFVSTYATTHAWEDFAETWAHYLHIIDTLETATAFGIEVHPEVATQPGMQASPRLDPYTPGHFDALIAEWLPLTYAMNAMNRSMGLNDLYPFVLSPHVVQKLAFIHNLVHLPRQAALAA